MKKSINLWLRIAMITVSLYAIQAIQAQSANQKTIYKAYINSDATKWSTTIRNIETNTPPTTTDQKLELVNFYYGYAGYLIAVRQNNLARKNITTAQKWIDRILTSTPKNSTALAYKGLFMGLEMSTNKTKSISLASQSLSAINKAYDSDPRNTLAIIAKANALYQAPAFFGGNKREAINFFLKAINQMETSKTADYNWTYLHTLITIAKAYEKQNRLQDAKLMYEKALRKEPNFALVKNNLYPAILIKLKK